jgi:hypothetical protein
VLSLAAGARDVPVGKGSERPRISIRGLGKRFAVFMLIVGIFDLGNSSDAFLVMRAQERGLSVIGVLGMLVTFNLVYTLVSTPGGALSDRIGRRRLIVGGWLIYAAIYVGFALARTGWHVWALYGVYGLYYGLAYGTAKAMVADLVPESLRGTAYGTYNAVLGLIDLPASLIAGVLWEGAGTWQGFGAPAPFLFGGGLALLAALLMAFAMPGGAKQGAAQIYRACGGCSNRSAPAPTTSWPSSEQIPGGDHAIQNSGTDGDQGFTVVLWHNVVRQRGRRGDVGTNVPPLPRGRHQLLRLRQRLCRRALGRDPGQARGRLPRRTGAHQQGRLSHGRGRERTRPLAPPRHAKRGGEPETAGDGPDRRLFRPHL